MKLKDMLPGVHRVKSRARDGRVSEYWYAWRGGPQILKVGPLKPAALAKAITAGLEGAAERFKAAVGSPADRATLYGLITRYLAPAPEAPHEPPPHLRHLGPRSLSDRRKHLDRARKDLGELEVRALDAKGSRKLLLDWRNGMAATPKSADDRLYALSCVLNWAEDNEEIGRNPIKSFDRIYSVDRSEIIWEPHHQEILFRHADPDFAHFAEVSMLSGIRLGDLRALLRTAPGPDAITFQTGKSKKRRTAVIPVYDELRAAMDKIVPSPKSATLLNSSLGTPWSEPGIQSALQRAKKRALAEAKKRLGGDAKSGIEHLRMHDMRGTAATNFMRWGMDDKQIADIFGWKLDQVREIRRRYVSGQEIGLAMVRRIRANKAAQDL